MIASRLKHLILIVRDGRQGQHLIQDVKLSIGALWNLWLSEHLPLRVAFRVLVVALSVDSMRHHSLCHGTCKLTVS